VEVRGVSLGAVASVRDQIAGGVRARLATQSLLTGQLYVSLDYHPDKPAVYKTSADASPPEIPTIPSETTEIRNTFGEVVAKVRALPLEELVGKLTSAATGLDRLMNKPELADAVDQVDAALVEARSALGRVDRRIDPLADETQATVAAAREVLSGLKGTIARLEGAAAGAEDLVEPGSPVQAQLLDTLQELARSARAVRTAAEELAQKPDSLIYGRGKEEPR
jgi:paraquat-inducible protein B